MIRVHEKIDVKLPHHQYQILIGSGLLESISNFVKPFLGRKRVVIISDETVANLYLPKLQKCLESELIECVSLVLPAGEQAKSWETLSLTVEWLIEKKVERDDIILAFGGGVIGDLAGFAASIVRRGVSIIQIPTTLLAQVDSSVGGKTGINSVHGKNLIGTFHQPVLVIIDTLMLKSLSNRDFLSGYSEVIKYGLLGDIKFFEWLENNSVDFFNFSPEHINYAIGRACYIKSQIVMKDEKENSGRALLNLGHTFGHALEAYTNYSDLLLHGEGVSIGCVLAFKFSRDLGFCSSENVKRVVNHFESVGLKTNLRDISLNLPDSWTIINLMLNDKKVKNGLLNLILVREIGEAFTHADVSLEELQSFLTKEMN